MRRIVGLLAISLAGALALPGQATSKEAPKPRAKVAAPAKQSPRAPARIAQAPAANANGGGGGAVELDDAPELMPPDDSSLWEGEEELEAGSTSVYYVEADYLHWWINGDSTPPLVTTSTPGTLRAQAGILGQPNTSVLFGGDDLNGDAHSGVRIVLGRWLTTYAKLEAEWFDLGEVESDFSATSTGTPILARPFFNVTTGFQDAFLVAFPGVREGTVSAHSSSRLMGAAITVIEDWDNGCDPENGHLALSCGFRYLRLEEDLSINDSLTSIDPVGPVPVGTGFTTSDTFDSSNDFFGFNFGARGQWHRDNWSFSCIGNLAVGQTVRRVNIAGRSSRTTPAGATTNFNGGLLALPTNIGDYRNTELGFVPQLQLKLAYDLTCNTRITVAYDALLWSSVARPGDQVDLNVNTTQASGQPLVGQAAPLFGFRESTLWVHGISVGGEWRF